MMQTPPVCAQAVSWNQAQPILQALVPNLQVTLRQEARRDDATALHTCWGCEGRAPLAEGAAWGGGSTWRLGWLLPRRPPNAHEHHL